MNWYKYAQESISYLYHGTSEGAFRNIRLNGLVPSNGGIWLTDNFNNALSYAMRKGFQGQDGLRLLRVKKNENMILDDRMVEDCDYICKTTIPPAQIELYLKSKWIPIQDYYNKNINIMPI